MMHFEILVEDMSGQKALDVLVPKILGNGHSYHLYQYKGIGHIPKNLGGMADPKKRILLDRLPQILRGYGKTHAAYPKNYLAAVIIVCDLDNKNLEDFHHQLIEILDRCNPKPLAAFCFAIEEGEAWYLGDIDAIKKSYPRAKDSILYSYKNDSICGTWELLADAIYPGGSQALKEAGWSKIGQQKSEWAEKIAPSMDIENNKSPSFCYFKDKLRQFASR